MESAASPGNFALSQRVVSVGTRRAGVVIDIAPRVGQDKVRIRFDSFGDEAAYEMNVKASRVVVENSSQGQALLHRTPCEPFDGPTDVIRDYFASVEPHVHIPETAEVVDIFRLLDVLIDAHFEWDGALSQVIGEHPAKRHRKILRDLQCIAELLRRAEASVDVVSDYYNKVTPHLKLACLLEATTCKEAFFYGKRGETTSCSSSRIDESMSKNTKVAVRFLASIGLAPPKVRSQDSGYFDLEAAIASGAFELFGEQPFGARLAFRAARQHNITAIIWQNSILPWLSLFAWTAKWPGVTNLYVGATVKTLAKLQERVPDKEIPLQDVQQEELAASIVQ